LLLGNFDFLRGNLVLADEVLEMAEVPVLIDNPTLGGLAALRYPEWPQRGKW